MRALKALVIIWLAIFSTAICATERQPTHKLAIASPESGIVFTGVPDSFEDGDSFWIGIHKIRLHGVDAPEPKQICGNSTQPMQCGQKALEFLKQLALKHPFKCNIHKGKAGKPWIMYGRYVGTCFAGKQNVGRELVRAGWALASDKPYGDNYRELQKQARKNKVGMHTTNKLKPPWEWRKGKRSNHCSDNGTIFQSLIPPLPSQRNK